MKKFLVLALAFAAVSGLLITNAVFAESEDGSFNFPPMIQKLIERFNLNPNEVEEFLGEVHQERQQEMQARFEDVLGAALEEGTLTEDQKQLILEKRLEMEAFHEELEGLTMEERRELMEERRQEMKTWAEENGIDLRLFGLFGGRKRGFGGCEFGFGPGGPKPELE